MKCCLRLQLDLLITLIEVMLRVEGEMILIPFPHFLINIKIHIRPIKKLIIILRDEISNNNSDFYGFIGYFLIISIFISIFPFKYQSRYF